MQHYITVTLLAVVYFIAGYNFGYRRGESKLRRQKIKEAKALRDSQPKAVVVKNR